MSTTISRRTFDELTQVFEDVRDDYSGRFMYGRECVGIVSEENGWTLRGELQEFVDDLDPEYDSEIIDDLRTLMESEPSTDSMGMSTIFYWPYVEVDKD